MGRGMIDDHAMSCFRDRACVNSSRPRPLISIPFCLPPSADCGSILHRGGIDRCLRWSAPEVLEPMRRKLGVAHRVLNVLVTEIRLQCACVVASIGQGLAAGMP